MLTHIHDDIIFRVISHTAKIVLNLINNRIAAIIEQQLSDSQYGFRTGRRTRDAKGMYVSCESWWKDVWK